MLPDPGGFVFEWQPSTGRFYSVLWSPNLYTNFTLLESGLEFPQNTFTDTLHGAENAGFYNIDVQLE